MNVYELLRAQGAKQITVLFHPVRRLEPPMLHPVRRLCNLLPDRTGLIHIVHLEADYRDQVRFRK